MGYVFEWDAKKAGANLRKHGITFDEAMTSFSDPLSILGIRTTLSAKGGILFSACPIDVGCWWWPSSSGPLGPA